MPVPVSKCHWHSVLCFEALQYPILRLLFQQHSSHEQQTTAKRSRFCFSDLGISDIISPSTKSLTEGDGVPWQLWHCTNTLHTCVHVSSSILSQKWQPGSAQQHCHPIGQSSSSENAAGQSTSTENTLSELLVADIPQAGNPTLCICVSSPHCPSPHQSSLQQRPWFSSNLTQAKVPNCANTKNPEGNRNYSCFALISPILRTSGLLAELWTMLTVPPCLTWAVGCSFLACALEDTGALTQSIHSLLMFNSFNQSIPGLVSSNQAVNSLTANLVMLRFSYTVD